MKFILGLIVWGAMLIGSEDALSLSEGELRGLAEQGYTENQLKLGELLIRKCGVIDELSIDSCLDGIMWLKLARQHSFPGTSSRMADTTLNQIGRASGILGDRLGLLQLVTDKLASKCLERFYYKCGFNFDKKLFPPNTVDNIKNILLRVRRNNSK